MQTIENLMKNKIVISSDNFQIDEILFENSKLVLVFTYESDILPDFSEVLSVFFKFINYDIPNHTSFTSPQYYKYNLRQGPENLFITKNGIIKWKPKDSNLGYNEVSFTANDGYYSDECTMKIFVNDTPKIISNPPEYVNINDNFTYPVVVQDKNKSDQHNYFLMESPKNAIISKEGILNWPVNENNSMTENVFIIGVTDSRDTTFQKFSLLINQKPEIKLPAQITSRVNKMINYKIHANDPEGKSLNYKIIESPERLQIIDGIITWKPQSKDIGKNSIKIEVQDEDGNYIISNFDIVIVKNKFDLKTVGLVLGSAILTSLIFILV